LTRRFLTRRFLTRRFLTRRFLTQNLLPLRLLLGCCLLRGLLALGFEPRSLGVSGLLADGFLS